MTSDVYVSSRYGEDKVGCGRDYQETPCLTVAYSVKAVANNGDRILLDNGARTRHPSTAVVYYESSTIIITKNLTLDVYTSISVTITPNTTNKHLGVQTEEEEREKKSNQQEKNFRNDHPKVVLKATKHPALFYMNCRSSCSFEIRNIIVRSPFTAFYIGGRFTGMVSVINSTLDSKLSLYAQTPTQPPGSNIRVSIVSSKVKGGLNLAGNVTLKASDSLFDVDNFFVTVEPVSRWDRLNVVFRNTSFRNGTFVTNSSNSKAACISNPANSFIFDSCTFEEFRISLRGVCKVQVHNSNFKRNELITSHNLASYSLSSNQHHSSPHYLAFIQIYRCEFLVITNTLFTNSSFGALSLSYCREVRISASRFINNKKRVEEGQGGGALLSFFSSVIIKSSQFEANEAVLGGGTIHHVGGSLQMRNIVMHTSTTQYNSVLFCQSRGSLDNVTIHVLNFVGNNRTVVTLLPFNVDFKRMGTWKIKSMLHVSCATDQQISTFYERTPFSNSTDRFTDITVGCSPCQKGTYSLHRGSLTLNSSKVTNKQFKQEAITCSKCPPQALCSSGEVVRSKGGSWGYRVGDTIEFQRCPLFYCCSPYGTPCISYNTCAKNREGPLCGRCKNSFSEDILSKKCIRDSKCTYKSVVTFWVIYILASVILTYILMYFKDAFLFVKMYFALKKKQRRKRKGYCSSPLRHVVSMEEPLLSSNNSMVNDKNDQENELSMSSTDESDQDDDYVQTDSENNSDKNNEISQIAGDDESAVLDNGQQDHHYQRIISPNEKTTLNCLSISSQNQNVTSFNSNNTLSGVFKILVQFYQIESMLRVDSPLKISLVSRLKFNTSVFIDLVLSVFNIKIIAPVGGSKARESTVSTFLLCPVQGMTAITKQFVLSSLPLACICVVLLSYIVNRCATRKKKPSDMIHCYYSIPSTTSSSNSDENQSNSSKPFVNRLKGCVLQLFLIGYATVSLYLLNLVNCVSIDGSHVAGLTSKGPTNVLYIQGDVECYQHWQYGIVAVIALWVIPFPLSLYLSSQMLVDGVMTSNKFIFTLFVPFYTVLKTLLHKIFTYKNTNGVYASLKGSLLKDDGDSTSSKQRKHNQHDTDILINILSGPFRKTRKLGHPLIVWESVMVLRRFLLCVVYVMLQEDEILKLYLMLILLVLFGVHHGFIQAFITKSLNIGETVSLAVLTLLCCVNFFWAYSKNDFHGESVSAPLSWHSYRSTGESFLMIEAVALLFPIASCLFYGLLYIGKKVKARFM